HQARRGQALGRDDQTGRRGNGLSYAVWIEANFRPPEEWNFTWPATSANSVSSPPLPTPSPGWIRVPRWRTITVPAVTAWPPNAFTPRRLASESRPFLVVPPPFLCAIAEKG